MYCVRIIYIYTLGDESQMKEFIANKINEIKKLKLFSVQNTDMKEIVQGLSLNSDDMRYKRNFKHVIGQKLYQSHLNENFISCAFCSHLKRSTCHKYCFACSKNTYKECSLLLPGIFPFTGSYTDSIDERTPWIFKIPCTSFERLADGDYFRNFTSLNQNITIANFEALEGIFNGLSRGKRPCHICAAVNLEMFNRCSNSDKSIENIFCERIIKETSPRYEAMSGLIKCVE